MVLRGMPAIMLTTFCEGTFVLVHELAGLSFIHLANMHNKSIKNTIWTTPLFMLMKDPTYPSLSTRLTLFLWFFGAVRLILGLNLISIACTTKLWVSFGRQSFKAWDCQSSKWAPWDCDYHYHWSHQGCGKDTGIWYYWSCLSLSMYFLNCELTWIEHMGDSSSIVSQFYYS